MNPLITIIQNDAQKISKEINFQELGGKTIIITGASGLIGTYLLAALAGCRKKGVYANIIAIVQNPFPEYLSDFGKDVHFVQGDLADVNLIASLGEADYIIHAAGYGQPGKFMENPAKTIELNTTCTNNLFKKLKQGGKFLFVSTSEVYSGLPNPPYREEQIGMTNTTHPRSCYIEGKRCGEAIVNAWRQKGFDAKSARLSLAYGPGTKPGDARVLNSFIFRALKEGQITLMDQGLAKRTYCYVVDAVEIMWNILFFGKEPIYNVGGVSKTTIGDLAKKIGAYLNVPVHFPEGDNVLSVAPEDVSLDMSKVENEFKE
ncbi:MAG: NAD-dependent epimerase/dehydratase family protein, partial [Patescibacteria group bacterium]